VRNISKASLCLLVSLFYTASYAQQTSCTMPAPQFQLDKPHIFSAQQEQWLGDAQAAQLEPDYTLLDEKDTLEITLIGKKLLAQLPPTPVQFTLRAYVDNEVNAFSIAGGHVYISRKLIIDAHDEDEVAGVLAHEIGHIYSHHMTVGETREMKALLHVTSLADRRDVEDKQQLLINAPWESGGNETIGERESAEVQADSIALYAMTSAGYAGTALTENLERITDSKGNTSLFLKILSGEDIEIALRVHSAHKLVNALSSGCKSTKTSSSPSFFEFQMKLRTEAPHWLVEPTPGLASTSLDPPLRPFLACIIHESARAQAS